MEHQYKNASYGGESVTLENGKIKLVMFKRICGWGWGEIYTPEGKLMAVLDHLGEMMARDQEIPMRMEAETYARETTAEGESLVFDVKATVVQEKLKNTSFDCWIHYAFGESCMRGQVRLTLLTDKPVIRVSMRYRSNINGCASYVRGPWLKVGQNSFGVKKDDSILPGVEWVVGDEWSSGTDWFKDPWAMRVAPHPNKVSAPVMALSEGGDTISLSWNATQMATGWFNNPRHVPQPVFATPDFIDRQNNNIFGLMVPAAIDDNHENQLVASQHPLELHLDQMVNFDADIAIGKGTSLDAVTDYVRATGLPEPSFDRAEMEARLHKIAHYYNTLYWKDGEGFGVPQSKPGTPCRHPYVPGFAKRYIEMYPDCPESKALQAKIDWCEANKKQGKRSIADARMPLSEETEQARKEAEEILSWQKPDGSFAFEPDGRHYTKDDFVVARSFIEPMGNGGDAALDICAVPALKLMLLGQKLGEQKYLDAAKRALDYCLTMSRPEAGDYWECPLHSPNLFATGHAANAYEYGYRVFGNEAYRKAAIYWIRGMFAFTHLYETKNVKMLYNTKPCLCSSDWYFANWVRDHVQWEVLASFLEAEHLGIDWGAVDPDVDWHKYQAGVTAAAMRWMTDHTNGVWLPHNLPWTYDEYVKGSFDGCYPDTHNSVTGNYGGAQIMPDPIAENIEIILGR